MKIENLATLVSDKCEGRDLCSNTYLSTENMLPNLGGYTQASSLPDFKVTRFIPGDILLSNIRPYFKKMVFADLNGGCSNDVVCIRANPSICLPKYLYYALSTDTFFDYYTSTCKGTKMPRGDKEMLLKYQIPVPEFAIQRHIVGTIGTIDDLIEKEEDLLEKLGKYDEQVFSSAFVNHHEKHYRLSDLCDFIPGYSYTGDELKESTVGMVTIKSVARTGGFKVDGLKDLMPMKEIKEDRMADIGDVLVAHTDLTKNKEVIGSPIIVTSKGGFDSLTFSMDMVKVVSKGNDFSNALIYQILKSSLFKDHALSYCNGSTVVHLSRKALETYGFEGPDSTKIHELNEKLSNTQKLEMDVTRKIERLTEIKKVLLSKYF